jgi:hypothetical protein
MKSQYYENDHYDIKRYNNSMKQYRLVIPVYNTSDSVFTIDGDKSFDFNTNMGVFLEAGKCLHRVEFSKGERFLLIMDFTTKDCDSLSAHYTCRNIVGYFNWCKDVVWRHLSSFHYRLSNL